jgi:L-asparaginase
VASILSKPRIAIFSGPNATIANSPPLVTSNKARLSGERLIPGHRDHLVPQVLYESVKVKIKKFSAHPLEHDSASVYSDDGKDYYEVELTPDDGPYLLPYMARRSNGTRKGVPFEALDMWNSSLGFGGRQFFYPDASWIFEDIDRSIAGRDPNGVGSILDKLADYEFIRVLPPGGYVSKGEKPGVDFFPYRPEPIAKIVRVGDLATAANLVTTSLSSKKFEGGIWMDGSPQVEESLYWLSLLIDTELPIVAIASQRPHGELSNDGDRNIVDSIQYVASGKGKGLGGVAISDQVVYAAREFKKSDARPGNYKATGGHGGILGSVKAGVTIWYRPNYKHTSESEVNLSKLPKKVEFQDRIGSSRMVSIKIKDSSLALIHSAIPHVSIFKYASYSQEDESGDPEQEVEIMARIQKILSDRSTPGRPKLHGIVYEGLSPYAVGSVSQLRALWIAAFSGIPVVRVGRSDPGGRVITDPNDPTIEGSNLDSNKARLLLIASMLKLGRLPRSSNPTNPSQQDRKYLAEKIALFQEIFETH